jgi:hypothetical protein
MAEWTIAAVLKTAELTAPGVRIPLPPFQFLTKTSSLDTVSLPTFSLLGT